MKKKIESLILCITVIQLITTNIVFAQYYLPRYKTQELDFENYDFIPMGTSAGGVSVKTETSKYTLKQIVKDLLGADLVQTDKYQDIRYPDKYYLVKTKDVITIYNSSYTQRFFNDLKHPDVQKFIDYFEKPELIFAHEQYDSGASYGYSLFYKGKSSRIFRSLSFETTIDVGELEDIEKNWRNGKASPYDLGDGEFTTMIKNLKTGSECDKETLPQVILNELQFEKLGLFNDYTKILESGYFIRSTEETINKKQVSDPKPKKSWWQIWK